MITVKVIDVGGEEHEFDGKAGETLLDQIRDQSGLSARFGCQGGSCGACQCVVRKGVESLVACGPFCTEILDDPVDAREFRTCIGALQEEHVTSGEKYEVELDLRG